MVSSDQVFALVQSHSEGDDSQFYSVAMQVAAKEARAGRAKFAQELRDLVDQVRVQSPVTPRVAPVTPLVLPRGDVASLLSVSYPDARLSDLVLAPEVGDAIETLLLEQRQRDMLARHGLTPSRRVLLIGPPGTGKTFTAHMIAGELGLPLFVIRFDALITKFMGETAAKLRLVFDELAETRGVYLFDEVDALAGDRGMSNDVGEIRRVLNSFLLFLESDASDSIILAATNHPRLLDPAVFRRFDSVIRFPLPDEDAARAVVQNRLSGFNLSSISWPRVLEAAVGLSHAEICVAAENAAKRAVLTRKSRIVTDSLVAALQGRPRKRSEGSGGD
jgi:SpoVK/Ycf46/Vps4 family AAA+-type ATPase